MYSIVIVTHNSAAVIADAIRSIPPGNETIVVDNASTDRSVAIAEELGATVVRNAENVGFGTACNIGAAKASGNRIFFLNPDARLAEDALAELDRAFDSYPEAGAFAPRIVREDGVQFFRKRSVLYTTYPWRRQKVPAGDSPILNASGAALAFPRRVFEELGGFDENIFLFFEDDDICLRTRKAGYVVQYVHSSEVVHSHGVGSPPSAEMTAFKTYHFVKAARYVCRKHGRSFRRWFRIPKSFMYLSLARAKGREMRAVEERARLRALLE